MSNPEISRCLECGGQIKLLTKSGRVRCIKVGVLSPVPDDFPTPICDRCGEEYMTPEVSERLDELLKTLYPNI